MEHAGTRPYRVDLRVDKSDGPPVVVPGVWHEADGTEVEDEDRIAELEARVKAREEAGTT